MSQNKKAAVGVALAALMITGLTWAGVEGSKHDFSNKAWTTGDTCSACHTPPSCFDLSVVMSADTPSGRRIEHVDTGRFAGTCTLTCHGFTHINFPYSNPAAGGAASRVRTVSRGLKR